MAPWALLGWACVPHGGAGLAVAELPVRAWTRAAAADAIWAPDARPPYVPPTPAEADAFARTLVGVFEASRTGVVPPEAVEGARALDLRIERWDIDGAPQIVLVEGRRRGAGAYLFAIDATRGPWTLIEAPHAYHDLDTGVIALSVLVEGGAGAMFTNTVHRYTTADGGRDPDPTHPHPADACHARGHWLDVATLAIARRAPGLLVAQLHGFEAAPGGPAVVVSGGEARVTRAASRVARALAASLGDGVRLFPTETDQYGATTNVQADGLRGHAPFVHLEADADVRRRWRDDPTARAALARAIAP